MAVPKTRFARHLLRLMAGVAALCFATSAWADGELSSILVPGQGFYPSQSDFGGMGLWQVPSARMGDEGDVRGEASFVTPYHRFAFSGNLFPWMEGVFRTTQVTNRLYGLGSGFGGHQSFRDRGFDLRFRLWQEDDTLPDITLGISDFAQLGQFDEEYLVATKRYGDFDVTLGLGWGQLASDAMFPNPFTLLSSHFDHRHPINQAGGFRTDFFTGPNMSLFGGFEYKTPIDGLIFKLDFNPNDFRNDSFGEFPDIRPTGPIDAGFVYRPFGSGLELSFGVEREDTAMVRVGFKTNFATRTGAEAPKPAAEAVPARAPVAPIPPDEVAFKDNATNIAAGPSNAARRVLPRADQVPEPMPPETWSAVGDLGRTADRFGFRLLSMGTVGGVRQVTLVRLADAHSNVYEDLGQFARMAGRLQPAVDHASLTLDEAGSERRFELDLPSLERTAAMIGRVGESVQAQNPAPAPAPAPRRTIEHLNGDVAQAIFDDLKAAKMIGYTFEIKGHEAILRLGNYRYRYAPKALGDAARIIDARAPVEVTEITIADIEGGLEVMRVRMRRADLQRAFTGTGSAAEVFAHAEFNGGGELGDGAVENKDVYPDFSYRVRPRLKSQLNGPDGFFLYSLYAGLSTDLQVRPGLTLSGEFGANILDNLKRLQNPSNSLLPHVRSDIAQYLKDGKYGIQSLYADYETRLGGDFYGRVTGGLLEEMYGGVDGELLYRPYGSRWALGLEANQLYKRGFHEQFSFQSYNVATAQVSLYYDMPWYGLQSTLTVGRYLARDVGFTYQMSREFESGVRVGGFFTITNVSAAKYGEGSFDKGLFISIPIDLITPFPSRSSVGTLYRPLTRDGGQLLDSPKQLYWETYGDDTEHLGQEWNSLTAP